MLLLDFIQLQYHSIGHNEKERRVIGIVRWVVYHYKALVDPLGKGRCQHALYPEVLKEVRFIG